MDLEGRVEDAVAEQDGPERLGDLFGAIFGTAEVEGGVVVVEREHGAQLFVFQREGRGETVDVQGDLVASIVVGRGDTGEVEGGGEGGEKGDDAEDGEQGA